MMDEYHISYYNDDFNTEIKYSLIAGICGAFGSVFADFGFSTFLLSDCAFVPHDYTPLESMNIRYFFMNTSFALTLLSLITCDTYLRCALRYCRNLSRPILITGFTNTFASALLGFILYGKCTGTLAWTVVGFVAQALGSYNFYKYDIDVWFERMDDICKAEKESVEELTVALPEEK